MIPQIVDPAAVGPQTAAFTNANYAEGKNEGFDQFYRAQVLACQLNPDGTRGDRRYGQPVIDPATMEEIGLNWNDTSEVQGLLVQGFAAYGVPAGGDFKALILGNRGPDTPENGSYVDFGLADGATPPKIKLVSGPIQGVGTHVTIVQGW